MVFHRESILGPLLFNIYPSELFQFFENSDIANNADDKSPLSCETDNPSLFQKLEKDSGTLLGWIRNNALKANPDKFHLLLSDNDEEYLIMVANFIIQNTKSEKLLLGIIFDNGLTFNSHVSEICSKANQKLHALSGVCNCMNFTQRKILLQAFTHPPFGYCPLVWMFHSRKLNSRINNIHERAFRIVHNDFVSSFAELNDHTKFQVKQTNRSKYCPSL